MKQRKPLSHTKQARSNLEPSDGVTNAKGAKGSNLSLSMREKGRHELGQLGGDFSEGQLGLTKVSTLLVPRSDERDTSSANKVNRELKPRDSAVEDRWVLRPRQLGPVPLDSFNGASIRLGVRAERHMSQKHAKIRDEATASTSSETVQRNLGGNIHQGKSNRGGILLRFVA